MCRNRRDKKHLLPVTRWGPESSEGGGSVKTCSPDPPLEVSRWACQLTAVPLHEACYCTMDRALFQTHCMVSEHKARVQEKKTDQSRWRHEMCWMQEKSSRRPTGEINDFIMEQKVEAWGDPLPCTLKWVLDLRAFGLKFAAWTQWKSINRHLTFTYTKYGGGESY